MRILKDYDSHKREMSTWADSGVAMIYFVCVFSCFPPFSLKAILVFILWYYLKVYKKSFIGFDGNNY